MAGISLSHLSHLSRSLSLSVYASWIQSSLSQSSGSVAKGQTTGTSTGGSTFLTGQPRLRWNSDGIASFQLLGQQGEVLWICMTCHVWGVSEIKMMHKNQGILKSRNMPKAIVYPQFDRIVNMCSGMPTYFKIQQTICQCAT